MATKTAEKDGRTGRPEERCRAGSASRVRSGTATPGMRRPAADALAVLEALLQDLRVPGVRHSPRAGRRDCSRGDQDPRAVRACAVPDGPQAGADRPQPHLLPQEEVKIYEYDRYRHATSTSARFSQRSTFFSYVSRVTESLASVKTDFGTAFPARSRSPAPRGGGIDLGIVSFGGEASSSASVSVSNHLDVDSVFETFRHVAEISSQAVETERSIVVSTFTENVSVDTTFRTLRTRTIAAR